MKAYLAAPIFSPEQLQVVSELNTGLVQERYRVFSPYAASRDIWAGRAPKDCTQEERDEVLTGNIENLQSPTRLLVAWVGGTSDGRVDTGVAWEMGFFYNRVIRGDWWEDQNIATLAFIHPSDVRKDMNLMLAGTVTAAVRGYDKFRDALGIFRLNGAMALRNAYNPRYLIADEMDPIA